jgi:hypothetical protein
MTEAEWLACIDPEPMLDFLGGKASDRKLRLFACAVWRSFAVGPGDGRRARELLKAVEAAEDYADGLRLFLPDAGRPGGWIVHQQDGLRVAVETVDLFSGGDLSPLLMSSRLRCVFGPLPFRPVNVTPGTLAWDGGTVRRLADSAYQERILPAGNFDPARLAVLADALEEAGADRELVEHLRVPGPHVRGCWLVDLLTGRE